VLAQHHQGQVTVGRLLALLHGIGIDISKRHLMRLLIVGQDGFVVEARDVPRAGLETAPWISVDDTGMRHGAANGVCTQIGNQDFAWFGTTTSMSRLDILGLLRAGHADYVINDAALGYMRDRRLARPMHDRLGSHATQLFADQAAWAAQLERLGMEGSLGRARIATEGTLWGSIAAHGFLQDAIIVSDDASQFDVGRHAPRWVHAERLVYRLDTFTEAQRAAQQHLRALIWRSTLTSRPIGRPTRRDGEASCARFERIFRLRPGCRAAVAIGPGG
jgi:hypothetical protein